MDKWEIKEKLHKIYNRLSDEFLFSCEDFEIVLSERLRSSNGNCNLRRRFENII